MRIRYRERPFGKDKPTTTLGEIIVIDDRCKGCGFCVEYCPNDVLELSESFNTKGYHPPYVKNAEKCVNCGFCRMICPEFAIFSIEVESMEEAVSDGKNKSF